MDPLTMLAAFGPLVMKLGESLIGRYIAPDVFKPSNVADWLQMRASDVTLFEVMNKAGEGGESYPWVNAIIRLQRPLVASVALGVWGYAHVAGVVDTGAIDNFAGAVGFYLFGDRTLFHSGRALSPAVKK